jgi:hypothetical protein
MELKDIFKMELYKNCNDKQYLFVVAILAMMAALSTFLFIVRMEVGSVFMSDTHTWFYIILVFTVLGYFVFSLLYPVHLLNVDYKNKVMSLIFASGVSRIKYYLVKVGATAITYLLATLAIALIPGIMFLVVYQEAFVELMRLAINEFSIADIAPFVLSSIFGLLLYIVMLATSVIITKGKVAGIFLFFLFLFLTSTISNIFIKPFSYYAVSGMFYTSVISSIICICIFSAIGVYVLRKQDL